MCGHSLPKPARSTSEEVFRVPPAPTPNSHAILRGPWVAHLCVLILFAYLHINLTEFFEGKDHGSFISIFWPLVAQKRKKKKTL